MRIRVLGSAAGGGFPQWNCNCRNCDGVRTGGIRAQPRTQSSIAVTADDLNWVLFNASPDILQQLKANRELQPARGIRDTGITAVILIDAQIDHTTGIADAAGRPAPAADVLHRHGPRRPEHRAIRCCAFSVTTAGWSRRRIGAGNGYAGFTIPGAPGLAFQAMPLKSAAPPYSPHRADPHPGDNIGVRITDTASGRSVFYAPGLGEIELMWKSRCETRDCVMVDGTFWTDDEMIRLGMSKKHAREIGHLPQSGEGGMMEWMDRFAKPRKILIHINNTNPILNDDSIDAAELPGAV